MQLDVKQSASQTVQGKNTYDVSKNDTLSSVSPSLFQLHWQPFVRSPVPICSCTTTGVHSFVGRATVYARADTFNVSVSS